MPKLTTADGKPKRLTDTIAKQLPLPTPPVPPKTGTVQEFHWCGVTPGFGVRITHRGARAWVFERRVDGETKRRTLGAVTGRGAISGEDARKQAIIISGELQQGTDRLQVKRAKRKAEKDDVTLEEAIKTYVDEKQVNERPLKPRTKSDYLSMVKAPEVAPVRLRTDGVTAKKGSGAELKGGELHTLADVPLSKLTGDDIRRLYSDLKKNRGPRRATYALAVLRAVLNWNTVVVPDNPLDKLVSKGKHRIVLPPTTGKKKKIVPRDKLGAWWRAACAAGKGDNRGWQTSADFARFVMLTGIRGGEGAGNDFELGILVRDVDLDARMILLPDTKNGKDHPIYLSEQAFEIVQRNIKGKKKGDKLFPHRSIRGTLRRICEAAQVEYLSPHKLRKTFASVAQNLVSVYCLKAMLNHASGGDVTGEHYVEVEEPELRDGWQRVADFIEDQSRPQRRPSIVGGQLQPEVYDDGEDNVVPVAAAKPTRRQLVRSAASR